MSEGGYQVLIERNGVSVTHIEEANLAAQLTGVGYITEEVDAKNGLWLVVLNEDAQFTMDHDGYIDLVSGPYLVTAEMP